MRAVLQRVSEAQVRVNDALIGEIGSGFLILLGIEAGDTDEDLAYLLTKVTGMRIFSDEQGRFNLDPSQAGAQMLVVSQFTLLGDCRRGRRPSFTDSAPPEEAEIFCRRFANGLRAAGFVVAEGEFGAHMQVHLVNDGPVTLLLDSRRRI